MSYVIFQKPIDTKVQECKTLYTNNKRGESKLVYSLIQTRQLYIRLVLSQVRRQYLRACRLLVWSVFHSWYGALSSWLCVLGFIKHKTIQKVNTFEIHKKYCGEYNLYSFSSNKLEVSPATTRVFNFNLLYTIPV